MSDRRNEIKEVLEEACGVVRDSARGPGKRVRLSPEVTDWLRGMSAGPAIPSPAPADPSVVAALAELAKMVSGCVKCELCRTRTQTVFSDGAPNADVVFVGEAPGADEDRQGVPFVGRAGQLLTDIIVKGMQMKRDDVYICNVIKCRPPENRNPLPGEIAMCEPYLIRQLELVRPKVICALGAYAAHSLLKTDLPIGRLRGSWHFYHGIPLRATYHPAYLLRNPADKRKTWDDIQEVLKVLSGETVPVQGQ